MFKGNPLLLDFFLDEEDGATVIGAFKPAAPKPAANLQPAAAAPTPASTNDVTPAMNSLKSLITPELIKSMYAYNYIF